MVLFPDQTAKSLFRFGGQVLERAGFGTIVLLVSGVDQHLNPLRELEFQGLVEEQEVLVGVLSLDRLNLKRVEISKRRHLKFNGNHTPPCGSWFEFP